MKSVIVVEHDPVEIEDDDEYNELSNKLESAVTSALDQDFPLGPLSDISLSARLGAARSDWERGKPCPECGNTTISVMESVEARYESQSGNFEYAKRGGADGPDFSVVCGDCVAHLARFDKLV